MRVEGIVSNQISNEDKKLIDAFLNEYTWMKYDLEQIKTLFNLEKNRILLMEVAKTFFSTLAYTYWDKFILYTAKINNKASDKAGNKNNSIYYLRDIYLNYTKTKPNILDSHIENIEKNSQKIKIIRSKFIAHSDRKELLNIMNEDHHIELQTIEMIFNEIGMILSIIYNKLFNIHQSLSITSEGSANAMLLILEKYKNEI